MIPEPRSYRLPSRDSVIESACMWGCVFTYCVWQLVKVAVFLFVWALDR